MKKEQLKKGMILRFKLEDGDKIVESLVRVTSINTGGKKNEIPAIIGMQYKFLAEKSFHFDTGHFTYFYEDDKSVQSQFSDLQGFLDRFQAKILK